MVAVVLSGFVRDSRSVFVSGLFGWWLVFDWLVPCFWEIASCCSCRMMSCTAGKVQMK